MILEFKTTFKYQDPLLADKVGSHIEEILKKFPCQEHDKILNDFNP